MEKIRSWFLTLIYICTYIADSESLLCALISFHGGSSGVNNIYRYSVEEGNYLGSLVKNPKDVQLRELRGMVLLKNGTVLFANAYKNSSRLLQTNSGCDSRTAKEFASEYLAHPYGLALHPTKNIIMASNQDTNTITQYDMNGNPIGSGVFTSVNSPRGLDFEADTGILWVSSSGTEEIQSFDSTGTMIRSIPISKPGGLTISGNLIFVSSDDSKNPIVLAVNTKTFQTESIFFTPNGGLTHPAGLQVVGDELFVLGQEKQELFHFNVSTTLYLGKVITDLPDSPEELLILNC